jgi:hypothetical protein
MQEPSFRDVAVLPVAAIATGVVIVLSTVIGQGASAEECPPGTHAMSMSEMGGSSDGSMGGMDHSQHMAMGGGSNCMPGTADSMGGMDMSGTDMGGAPTEDAPSHDMQDMSGMDHDTMPAEKAPAKKAPAKKASAKKTAKHSSSKHMSEEGMKHSMDMR